MSASVNEEDKFIAQASGQHLVCNTDPGKVPAILSPAPLRHSVMQLHLDSQPSRNKLKPDQSGDPVPDDTPHRQVGFYGNQTVPDFLVDVNVDGGGDSVPKPAPSELAEHSTSVEHSPGQDIRCRMTHQAEQSVFMTVRQCQTSWWTRRQTEVVIQCRGRHCRSLQSIRSQWNIASGRCSQNRQNIRSIHHTEWWGLLTISQCQNRRNKRGQVVP